MQNALAWLAMTQYQSQLWLKQNKQKCKWKLTLQRDRHMRIWTILQQLLQTSWLNTRNLVFHSLQLSNHVFKSLHSQDFPSWLSHSNDWEYSSKSCIQAICWNEAWELSDIQKMQLQAQISERADIRNFQQQKELCKTQSRYRASWLSI